MGRGSSKVQNRSVAFGVPAGVAYAEASKDYTIDYQPYARGQISKIDAGQLYKAVKSNSVKARPELVSDLYDATKSPVKTAMMRYTQDSGYYDNVQHLTHALLNSDYKTAQKLIDAIEKDNIERAAKKSRWYKYKKG